MEILLNLIKEGIYMKIIPGKFPEEKDIEKYISFVSDESRNCSLVFLRRLAAFARDNGHKMTGIIGRRSSIKQQQLWDADLKKNKGRPSEKVARPFTSWHEFGCAVDLDGDY
ncbi:D-alanyl-D-alanine carboxypeptidase family protein [Ruminiclostridium cellobioparum]|nr:D-alanyl-D-alanine carboxypeptidase family protein [Ruminiclostridium cellobioparum]